MLSQEYVRVALLVARPWRVRRRIMPTSDLATQCGRSTRRAGGRPEQHLCLGLRHIELHALKAGPRGGQSFCARLVIAT